MPHTALTHLPDQLSVFVREFAETGDSKAAAIAAGVHANRAATFARHALNDPTIKAAIEYAVRSRFAEAGPIALNVILKFARNAENKYSPELQLTAARDLANRAGFDTKGNRDASNESKDLTEMSPDELRHVLDSTEAELAARAKTIESAPEVGASNVQVIDLEG